MNSLFFCALNTIGKLLPKSLGRIANVDDPRSAAYRVNFKANAAGLKSKEWQRSVGPLNQWFTSACTGYAAVGLLATEPNRSGLPKDTVLNRELALKIYSLATRKDNFGWTYPPTDRGSSILAAMKACKELGLISEYRWCSGLDDVLMALSYAGPVAIGVDWYEGFNRPSCDGLITISGKRTGGHAVHLYGIDVERREVLGYNSYGYFWGDGGKFRMSFDDLSYLLSRGGDAVLAVV